MGWYCSQSWHVRTIDVTLNRMMCKKRFGCSFDAFPCLCNAMTWESVVACCIVMEIDTESCVPAKTNGL